MKNKIVVLSIFLVFLYITLKLYKTPVENLMSSIIQKEEPNILQNEVTKQLEDKMQADVENIYIDNDILSGKLQLPSVDYIEPNVPISNEIEYINEQNITLEDISKAGGIVFPNDYTQFQKFDSKILKYAVQPDNAYPALDMYPRKL